MNTYLFIDNKKTHYKLKWVNAIDLITNESQTRNRNDVGSIAQINHIAANLIPELLADSFELSTGAPVIDTDNNIISGHGRILAIKSAYHSDGNFTKYYDYQDYLINHFKLPIISNVNQSRQDCWVLCRVISKKYNTVSNVHNANCSTLSYTPYEIAKINAKRIGNSIDDFINNLSVNERAQYYTNNLINLKAYDDYQNAKIIKALPDCEILQNFINYPNPDFKNVISAILTNIDAIIETKNNNVTLFNSLALALDKFYQVKANNGNIDDFLLQLDIFDGGYNADFSNLLTILWDNTRSAKKMAQEIAQYIHNQHDNNNLFDDILLASFNLENTNLEGANLELSNINNHIIEQVNGLNNPESNPTIAESGTTPPPTSKITPRDWQEQTLQRVTSEVQADNNRLLVSAPTGSGKAFLLMFIVQLMVNQGKHVLLLVDRRKLVTQLCESADKFGFNYNKLMGDIRVFNDNNLLTIASIQTYYRSEYRHASHNDVILVDECHTLYTGIVDDLINFKGLIVGCTATPSTKALKRYYPVLINEITQLELEQDKILTPLTINEKEYINMDDATVNSLGEWNPAEIAERCQPAFDGWIIDNIMTTLESHSHSIAFCASIAHCEELQRRVAPLGVKPALYTSLQSECERNNTLLAYENGDIDILITVATLSKGFDCSIIDLIIDLRPLRTSFAEYAQMIGRGTRIHENKQFCTVLDFTGNWDRFGDAILDMRANGVESIYNNTWTEVDELMYTEGLSRTKAERIAYERSPQGLADAQAEEQRILELERVMKLRINTLLDNARNKNTDLLDKYRKKLARQGNTPELI